MIALAGWPSAAGAYRAYVTNQDDHEVSVIDTATNAFAVPNMQAQVQPFGIAITPDGTRAYVSSFDTVHVIDTQTDIVATTIAVGQVGRGVALTPDGTRAYVVHNADDNVSVIDTASNTVVTTIAVGDHPDGIAIANTPNGTRAYVANDWDSTVSVIDTVTEAVTGTIPIGPAFSSGPRGVAITPDGTRAYVAGFDNDTVSVIDTATDVVVPPAIALPAGGEPKYIAITPDGSQAYVGNSEHDTVSVIDTATNTVVGAPIPLGVTPQGDFPHGIAFTPDGALAYVANAGGQADVAVIDTATATMVDAIDFPNFSGPTGIAIADVPPIAGPTAQTAAAIPEPVVGKTVNLEPVSGEVKRRCPGETGFTDLTAPEQVAVGCVIDTRRGTVRLVSARGSGGGTQSAEFWDGLFRVSQKEGGRPYTQIGLAGLHDCGASKKRRGSRRSSGTLAEAAATRGGKVWGSGSGRYRTQGNRGSATVRGTTWLVADRCRSTLFKVTDGVVSVRDKAKRGTITLREGKRTRYVARAPGG